MPSAIYQDLNVEQQEIRLIQLSAGRPEDPITAELSTVSLDDSGCPSYEALSYVWGDSRFGREITLCSNAFTVTMNLHAALIRMRFPDRARRIWVDAICINQEDTTERGIQVRIMRTIYSRSTQVLVWLGVEEPGDAVAMEFIRANSKGEQVLAPCDPECRGVRGIPEVKKCHGPLQRIGALVRRPWWTRTWTLQEVILARDATLFCGDLEISYKLLLKCYDTIRLERIKPDQQLPQICSDCMKATLAFGFIVGKLPYIETVSRTKSCSLLDVVVLNRVRSATDPRDKIFGLFGIASQDSESLRLDYSAAVEYIYSYFTWETLLRQGDLKILANAVDNDRGSLNLPSWVPDWTCDSRREDMHEFLRMSNYKNYDASNSQQLAGKLHPHVATFLLELNGIKIDTVSAVGDLYPISQEAEQNILKRWLTLSGVEDGPSRHYLKSGLRIQTAFWRTVVSDVTTKFGAGFASTEIVRPVPDTFERVFWKAWNISQPGEVIRGNDDDAENRDFRAIQSSILTSAQGRRFSVSQEGLFMNSPHGVQEGDEIWIVKGGRMPLILRKVEAKLMLKTEGRLISVYRFIGDCYVHGIMDGERASNDESKYQRVFLG